MRRILRWLWAPLLLLAGAAGWIVWLEYGADPAPEAERLVKELGLGGAFYLADIGAGNGRLTIPIARRYPESRLFATEMDAEKVSRLGRRLAAANIGNVTLLRGDATHANLPNGCCDALVLRRVYHHVGRITGFNQSLFDALGPEGRIAVIDFAPQAWMFWLPRLENGHGTPAEVLHREMTEAGFVLKKHIPGWSWFDYCSIFEKRIGRRGVVPQ
jgi:SAM-dependent methyltransferase